MACTRQGDRNPSGPQHKSKNRPPDGGRFLRYGDLTSLFHVSGDELRHLEHRDLALVVEERLQLVIREDVALIGRILKVILLDIFPKLLNDFGAGHRPRADDGLKACIEGKGFG